VTSAALLRALSTSSLRPLPSTAAELLHDLEAPPRLGAHLRLVHDVAWSLTDALGRRWPSLDFDTTAVLFGAAVHDVGKTIHPEELSGPGSAHEAAGEQLLLRYGVPAHLARFAGSHGTWEAPERGVEDLLVTLADKVWKAKRIPELEQRVIELIGGAPWETFRQLDDVLGDLAEGADQRLAFQSAFGLSG
jgi:hypothetical protein